jgi:hypothetical protein
LDVGPEAEPISENFIGNHVVSVDLGEQDQRGAHADVVAEVNKALGCVPKVISCTGLSVGQLADSHDTLIGVHHVPGDLESF